MLRQTLRSSMLRGFRTATDPSNSSSGDFCREGVKIVHVFPYSAEVSGGHSNAIRAFLACQQAAGLEVVGLSPSSGDARGSGAADGPRLLALDFGDRAQLAGIIAELSQDRHPILHLHAINALTTQLAAAACRAGIPVALTSHGQLNARSLLHAAKKFVFLSLCRSALRYASGVHLLTCREQRLLRFLAPGFRGEVAVLPHVIESSDRPMADTSDNTGPFTILHLGRLDVVTKGLDLLLAGFARCQIGRARLVLAGPDWDDGRRQLEELAADLGCADRVVFPGAVHGPDKQRWFASANLFAAASRWDAFNISLAEALSRGIPAIVSSRMNLAPELAQAGGAEIVGCSARGFAHGIRRLALDPKRRFDIATRGREWVDSHCRAQTVGAGFLMFYQRLMPSHLAARR